MNFRIVTAHVTSDILEGEAVIVNLHSGAYFSAADAGAVVWMMLHRRASFEHLLAVLKSSLPSAADVLEGDLRSFLSILEAEGLIEQGNFSIEDCVLDSKVFDFEYRGMQLQRYDDMQDLLALDPIHEVEERGWPFSNEQ